jgi:hypothetical protein
VHSRDQHVIAIDGKRIRQPLTNETSKQRFVGWVSLFAVEAGLSVKLKTVLNILTNRANVIFSLLT